MKIKKIAAIVFIFVLPAVLPAQEALKSIEEEYYDFLSLQGLVKRPTLNYRTLSDSVWTLDQDAAHPWQEQKFHTTLTLFNAATLRIYGPELFMSGNTAAPYGQNDGALWQGKGFNASFSAGVRFEGWGIEATFKPQLAFSQNAAFDIMPSNYDSEYGYFWGYGHNAGIDAPQRFGDKPFFTFDWGDTEIRYTWKTLTIGFGTQAIWLGPAYLNPILHSNNAPTYPKFDIGLRRQRVTLPWLGWYLGDVEARLWVGRLAESDYFDNDDSNNYTMFHGLSFAYAPSFLPGLTLFANRVCLVEWQWENLKYMFPSDANTIEDQKMSFGVSWFFPQVGFEVYGELGIDDYTYRTTGYEEYIAKTLGLFRHLTHTMVYTIGTKKTVNIIPQRGIYGELIFEWNSMEMSQDFQFQWMYSFYFHGNIASGYTNKGQWIGNASSPGGNSQYLEFKLYYPKGTSSFFMHRYNPDDNFLYSQAVNAGAEMDNLNERFSKSFKANMVFGLKTEYSIFANLKIGGVFAYNLIVNPHYYMNRPEVFNDNFLHNFNIAFRVQYSF
jgi:hypothetical protein